MNELERLIRKKIESEGPISVSAYMALALQHPSYGYYVKGEPLGHGGDFTTAPEISQMFGEMIGLWGAEIWRQLGKPASFALLEMGPGRGTLMQDALRATAKVDGFHQALNLFLIESNATLRAQQEAKLAPFAPRYIETLAALPPLPLLVIANEFLDALPIRQYMKTTDGWRERFVGLQKDELVFVLGDAAVALPFPDSLAFFELAPQAVALAREAAAHIVAHGGAALCVDYGYATPSGQDTLQAVSRHATVRNPLERPGEIDLTAHVDFSALRAIAAKEGAQVSAVVRQADFLRGMGIELRAEQLKRRATGTQSYDIDLALHRLTDEAQMGALFKAFAFASTVIQDLPGFP